MIHVKKIMVPVDFSEPSKKAVNYGLSLASEFGAKPGTGAHHLSSTRFPTREPRCSYCA